MTIDPKALDAHIQGIYDFYAPFNQCEFLHPMCENCDLVEDCTEPCEKVLNEFDKYYAEQAKLDRGHYMSFLINLSEYDYERFIKNWNTEILMDFEGLRNLGLTYI